ncbi:agamous-like MADS-box protein MADS2 isoform X1 [Cannabis sativa]|uniref:agamous-like MADS-box protein MADS2 isoform X1 n=1 Tax=Cannabis sativa TaxID=3483 RepID=UPI0029CA9F5B|nr:agamous-like MADS-box protein MADS2 isoform X1 [Cannabis sativa]
MGRGRVELKRIENKINRQVTFAKRRNGLLKKAYELSVLCEAEVAVIIFSNRGKLYEFCSGSSSMVKTVEKYKKYSYGGLDATQPLIDSHENSYQEYLKLKARVEVLQKSQRNLLGEDLGPLNTKELEQLENQLEISLRHIRSTKTQCLLDQLNDLQHREQFLLEANKTLRRKLEENSTQNPLRLAWEAAAEEHNNNAYTHLPSETDQGFYQPLGNNCTLQTGYSNSAGPTEMNGGAPAQTLNGYMHGWML